MNVLLINPPWPRRKGNIWNNIASCMPPIGLALLASYLEQKAVSVKIFDAPAEKISKAGIQNFLKKIKIPHSFIGITSTTSIIGEALAIASISKHVFPNARIVFGGVHPSVLPEEVLFYKFYQLKIY